MSESVSSKAYLSYGQMRAMLQTLAADDHALIHKLEIRRKQNGEYVLIANVSRVEEPESNEETKNQTEEK